MGDFLLTPHNLSQHTAAQYHQQVQSTSSSPTPAVRGLWEPNSKQIVNKSYQDKRRNQNINKSPIKLNTSSSSSSSLLLRKPNHDSNARNQIRMNNVTNDRRNYEEKKNDSKFQEKEDDEGGGGGGGAVLSLDEVAYDRDLKWYNKASSERVRPELNKNGQFYHNMTKVTNHNMLEQKSLDQHYYNLDQRKISKDQELNKLIKNNEKQQQNKKNKKKKKSIK